ncbi:MAG: DUF4145 domain-containing protein [Oscillospiraceae bacterium]|nr:DUF4145 domain-containing protein [Oscillospiraceae bacterium]
MSNFSFLTNIKEYTLFSVAVIEAEKVYATSPAMCAVGCRKALELAVKWVYSADKTIQMPYKDNLSSLIHETYFRFAVDSRHEASCRQLSSWEIPLYILKIVDKELFDNKAVHRCVNLCSKDFNKSNT